MTPRHGQSEAEQSDADGGKKKKRKKARPKVPRLGSQPDMGEDAVPSASPKNKQPMVAPPGWCVVCEKDFQSRAALAEHCRGKKHAAALRRHPPSASPKNHDPPSASPKSRDPPSASPKSRDPPSASMKSRELSWSIERPVTWKGEHPFSADPGDHAETPFDAYVPLNVRIHRHILIDVREVWSFAAGTPTLLRS